MEVDPAIGGVIAEALDDIVRGLEQAISAIERVKAVLREKESKTNSISPGDPNNKVTVGGLEKLTERGVEICYRLFDSGKSRYAVAQLMNMSFGAANHRLEAWKKAGGRSRTRKNI